MFVKVNFDNQLIKIFRQTQNDSNYTYQPATFLIKMSDVTLKITIK